MMSVAIWGPYCATRERLYAAGMAHEVVSLATDIETALHQSALSVLGMTLFDPSVPVPTSPLAQVLAQYRDLYLQAKQLHTNRPSMRTIEGMAKLVDRMWNTIHQAATTVAAHQHATRVLRAQQRSAQERYAHDARLTRDTASRVNLPGLANAMSLYDDIP